MRRFAQLWSRILAVAFLTFGSQGLVAESSKVPYIGLLSPSDPVAGQALEWGFRAGLKELNYLEGKTIEIEPRWAHGQLERLPALAAELVQLHVDVIVAFVTSASLAAQAATQTIPIVIVGIGDPVGAGLARSLANPGGNITGTSGRNSETVSKQIELLKGVNPALTDVAVLWNPANPVFQALQLREVEIAARTSGVKLRLLEASEPAQLASAFATMAAEGGRTLLILADPLFILHRQSLVELAAEQKLLTATGFREFAEAGGLMAYGPSTFDLGRRAATYVDKILKGAKPADLPIEQATKFELIINLKTAKALGLTIPPSLLARADEVIE